MNVLIKSRIQQSIDAKILMLDNPFILDTIEKVASACIKAYQHGHKILFAGNGGSAADAQHLAAELSGRYYYDRPPLYAEALHVNTSYLTAVANDYSFENVYARMVQAAGKQGDILIALSTSGSSPNILAALKAASEKKMIRVGMMGYPGGKMLEETDYQIVIPSSDTPRIQECHILVGHILCEIIEKNIFPKT